MEKKCQRIQNINFKNEQWLQRGYKQISEWSKGGNTRFGWEVQQREIVKR
jgi:hypothetical protein